MGSVGGMPDPRPGEQRQGQPLPTAGGRGLTGDTFHPADTGQETVGGDELLGAVGRRQEVWWTQ